MDHLRFVNDTLETSTRAYQSHVRLAVGLVITGLTLIIAGSLSTTILVTDYWKWLLTLGGGFTASLSGTRLNDIYSAKSRVQALRILKYELESFSPLEDLTTDATKTKERVEKLFESALGI